MGIATSSRARFVLALWCAPLAAALSGCVSVRPTVVATAAPSAESGYVAGVFSRTGRDRFGLGIVDAAGQEFVMPFGDSSQEETAQGRLAMIDLPPGEYRVAFWVTYAALGTKQGIKKDFPATHAIARKFTVRPGQVVFLGAFSAETVTSYRRVDWTIGLRRIGEAGATTMFRQGYPAFREASIQCLQCSAAPAAAAAAPSRPGVPAVKVRPQ